MERVTIDFETRSACSLKAHGPWRYSQHPTTSLLCMAFRLPYWPAGQTGLFVPGGGDGPLLRELFDWIRAGEPVEAHNVWSEYCVWTNLASVEYGWPAVPLGQWRCSAAKAASHALPRSLEKAASALGLTVVKDKTARPLLLKMTKPRKPLKRERESPNFDASNVLWHESSEQLSRLYQYCRQDVLAEEALSAVLPDPREPEQPLVTVNLTINLRGFQLDLEAVTSAITILTSSAERLNRELRELTRGAVATATQRPKLLAWLKTNGVDTPDTQAATVDGVL